MLSELIRAIYDSSGMDWATAEKAVYTMLSFMESKMPPEDYENAKKYLLGYAEYKLPDRTIYPGYGAVVPDQARGK
jgi:hypothetical protein